MKAVILAAGVGGRLKDFTKGAPKCLLKMGEETLLGREIRMLKELGFAAEDILVVAGYKHEMLNRCGATVLVNEKYDVLDNSYSLAIALQNVQNDDVIIMDADLIFDREILEDILSDKRENILLSKRSQDEEESTGIVTNTDGIASAIGKQYKNTGYVYISIFKVGKKHTHSFVEKLLLPRESRTWYTTALTELMKETNFYNKTVNHRWHEVDFVEDYWEARELFELGDDE